MIGLDAEVQKVKIRDLLLDLVYDVEATTNAGYSFDIETEVNKAVSAILEVIVEVGLEVIRETHQHQTDLDLHGPWNGRPW